MGDAAVPCFYVLSGYVIALNHMGAIELSSFIVRRLARLMPLYYLSNVVMIGVHACGTGSSASTGILPLI